MLEHIGHFVRTPGSRPVDANPPRASSIWPIGAALSGRPASARWTASPRGPHSPSVASYFGNQMLGQSNSGQGCCKRYPLQDRDPCIARSLQGRTLASGGYRWAPLEPPLHLSGARCFQRRGFLPCAPLPGHQLCLMNCRRMLGSKPAGRAQGVYMSHIYFVNICVAIRCCGAHPGKGILA